MLNSKTVLIGLLFCLMFVFCIHTLTWITYDLGLHLTLGKLVVQDYNIIKTNFFSYTNPDFPWENNYWFGKVLLYVGYLYAGLKGLIVFKAIIITAAFALAYLAFYRKEILIPSLISGLLSIFILVERTDVRPEIFSYLFLAGYLFILYKKPHSKWLWLLPCIQLLWVNTHIYFFLGPLIYALFLFGQYIGEKKSPSRLQLGVGGLILAVNILSPYGISGVFYPLSVFGNYGYEVGENFSPYSRVALGYPAMTTYAFTLGMFFGVITFLANYRNIGKNIFSLGLFIATSIMGIVMLRNMPLLALCLLPVSMKNMFEAGWFVQHSRSKLIYVSAGIVILITLVMNNFVYKGFANADIDHKFGLNIPTEGQAAIKFVKDNNIQGPVFNDYDVGNYLIWQLSDQKVFIDGRPEAYPADFIKNVYIGMQNDPALFERYSNEYGFNYIFWNRYDNTLPSQKFIKSLNKNPNWRLVFKDEAFGIFVKNTSQNAAIKLVN